ncbi:MAG TPA: hypothetical protein VG146_17665 [Verrucomicrobiae bacterium]|nr:hypothetical protein [Verrucomicrobiae bacterium]
MSETSENGQSAAVERLVEDIKVVVRDGQDLLRAGVANMREVARTRAEMAAQRVRERPYQSLSLVFGIGLALGAMVVAFWKRRGDDD